ncbi:ATP-dependent helicase HrpB [Hydrogenimonas sp.]
MTSLPIHTILSDLKSVLAANNSVILQADPGAGKTTVVPLALLDEPWLKGKRIVMLEPRRLAARAAALRMAETLGEKVGETVGYRMKGETKVSPSTRIEVVTEGVLTRILQSDPELGGVGLVIFDEFHERSLQGDLGLALTLQCQEVFRDDLKILVMSATLEGERLRALLGGAPLVRSEGRSHPVEIRHLDIKTPLPGPKGVAEAAAKKVLEALKKEDGSLLVFLPGVAEISRAAEYLRERVDESVIVAPLFGAMEARAQRMAIEPAPEGRRKVVLATNIAETSLTIEGVRVVIDSGLERRVRYDVASGMDRYETGFISTDSAIQRAGRAGRTAPGVCYRLWHETHALKPHREPEILTSDLAPMMLELAAWGTEPEELLLLDTAPKHAVEEAKSLLRELQMLDTKEALTPHGEAAMRLGTHPRIAHMLLKAKTMDMAYEAALLALLWQERPFKNAPIDLGEQMERLHRQMPRRLEAQLTQTLHRLQARPKPSPDTQTAGLLTAFAYPDRISRRRENGEGYLSAAGKGLRLPRENALAVSEWLAVAESGGGGSVGTIRSAARLSEKTINEHFGYLLATKERVVWDEKNGRVEAREVTTLGSITHKSRPIPDPDPGLLARGLLEGIRRKGLAALPWDKVSTAMLQRLRFVHRHMPDMLPDMGEEALLVSLEEWLLPFVEGMRSLEDLKRLDMKMILTGMVGWEAAQKFDILAPERIGVPSGSKIALDYSDPENPVLPVRLQEVYGWSESPRILEGRVALTLHLLSPARRPLAVTGDLKSFWQNIYPDVRKEMRGRYPRHYWPEDPFTAQPTRKTKKQMERS